MLPWHLNSRGFFFLHLNCKSVVSVNGEQSLANGELCLRLEEETFAQVLCVSAFQGQLGQQEYEGCH